jgi:hypothetical protein
MLLLFLDAQLRKSDALMILILFFFCSLFAVPKRNFKFVRFKRSVFIHIVLSFKFSYLLFVLDFY